MKPDSRSPGGDVPTTPRNSPAPVIPSRDTSPIAPTADERASQRAAAAQLLRTKIDTIYGDNQVATSAAQDETPAATVHDTNPYHRTHSSHPQPEAEQWKAYHSAWQNYYQQYYSGYYHAQLAQKDKEDASTTAPNYFTRTHDTHPTHTEEPQDPDTMSRDEALYDLRQKLIGKVQYSASKARRSRHFWPIVAALTVVLVFVFVQFNRAIIANVQAYVTPGNADPQNIIIDPSADLAVSDEPRLIIPKINVDVPVMYDVGVDHDSQMAAMENGVAHFPIPGANSHPGEVGNTVIAGHSSNDLFDVGAYKFIFAQLEQLAVGDTIYANYEGTRYTYIITKTEVVKPTEVDKLIYPTDKPVMTLITCTPLGTALNRLLVTAEQVSPDPSQADDAPEGSGEAEEEVIIPGNSPTFLERIFGGR